MFIMSEPKDHYLHETCINSVIGSIKGSPVLSHSFQDHKNATFILIKDASNGISGGAILFKQIVTAAHKKIERYGPVLPFFMEKTTFSLNMNLFVNHSIKVFTSNSLSLE